MVTSEQPNIPNFTIYGGTSASSTQDANGTVFYANCGRYAPNGNTFGLYLFKIGANTVEHIPLTPFCEARGVLTVDAQGLALTSTLNKKFIRYEIADYVRPAGGGQVVTGDAADQQARNAVAALQARVGHLEAEEQADDTRDADQATRIAKLERRLAALEARPAGGLTLDALKAFLWNDRFLIDLLYDIIANRKDGGILGAIRAAIRG